MRCFDADMANPVWRRRRAVRRRRLLSGPTAAAQSSSSAGRPWRTHSTRIFTVAQGFDPLEHTRRAIVAIGAPNVFDIDEPFERDASVGFYNRNDFSAAVQQVWQDNGHYDLLGYTPAGSTRELHDSDVTTTRPGVHLRARRTR